MHPCNVSDLFACRLIKLFPHIELEIKFANWQEVLKELKKCSTHVVMCVAKTFVNGWATTHRYHEQNRLPCIFGVPRSIKQIILSGLCTLAFFLLFCVMRKYENLW